MSADAARAALETARRVKEQQTTAYRPASFREPPRPPGSRLPNRSDVPASEAPDGQVRCEPGRIVLSAETVETAGSLKLSARGRGLVIAEGVNASQGIVTLKDGGVSVHTTSVTAQSRIFLCGQKDGGVPGWLRVSQITPGVGFSITSSSSRDESIVAYWITEGN